MTSVPRILLTTVLIIGAVAAGAVSALAAQRDAHAVAVPSVAAPPGPVLRLPLPGPPVVTRPFAPPPRPWLPGHRGVDLAAAPGTPVRAAAAGVVVFAGDLAGRPLVSIAHVGGLRTTYEPVRPSVARGDRVTAGEVIGVLEAGHPGCPAAACLHWGARLGETYVDPLALLGPVRVRLKPLETGLGPPAVLPALAFARARPRAPVPSLPSSRLRRLGAPQSSFGRREAVQALGWAWS